LSLIAINERSSISYSFTFNVGLNYAQGELEQSNNETNNIKTISNEIFKRGKIHPVVDNRYINDGPDDEEL
jgi:hypothetical protein